MRTTIEKVRAGMVVGAALLAMIVAGFLAIAHLKTHRLLHDLPERLGADIEKETNGYTYSQSIKGRTVFTLHAAKARQRKDGITALQDVGLVLYGQKDGRADRIYGKQFEYDQKHGVVRAMGEVELDLQAPAPTSAGLRSAYAHGEAAAPAPATSGEAQPIHVVTSGLVYVQSLGVASTDQPIRFSYRGMTGQARGAEYNSVTGVTTLENEVRLATLRDGRPMVLTATHAELQRASHEVVLKTARYLALEKAESDRGSSEVMRAGVMVVHLGADGGGIERAEGSDGVEVASGQSRMEAPNAVVRMDAEGRPAMAQMTGGVRFASEPETPQTPGTAMEGRAAAGVAHFDEHGAITTVQMTGGVEARSPGAAAGEMRTMTGDAMDLVLAGQAGGSKRWIQQATMRGDARVTTELPEQAGHTAGSDEMRGDTLVADWRQEHGDAVLHEVRGEGHTAIRRLRDGADEVSRGDHFRAEFAAGPTAHGEATSSRASLATAVQSGSVAIDRVAKTKAKLTGEAQSETTHARAEQMIYDAALGRVRLTGEPEISDGESQVRAQMITLLESTGDTEATGAVQVTYRQVTAEGTEGAPGGSDTSAREPMHAVADRVVLRKENGVAMFYGAPKQRARLWQGGSQVEAPVLLFDRKAQTLDAYGTAAGEAMPVHTVLAGKAEADVRVSGEGKQQVVLVQSGRLHFEEKERRANFSKSVRLADAGGTMTCRDAVATLAPATKTEPSRAKEQKGAAAAMPEGLAGGELERVLATGDVEIRQPGRVATGQKAVYTAADGLFVLTGGGGVLPKVTDEVNGSVEGAALRFRSGDNSVTVDGRAKDSLPVAGDGRVHTRTKVKP